MKIKLLLVALSLMLSGCTLVGAAIDHKIDDNSHSRGHHQEGSPFTSLGIALDIEIFKQLIINDSDENSSNN